MKLRRTKKLCQFLGHPLLIQYYAVFMWLTTVCSSEIISGRFILWNLLNNSLSTARSHQNPPAASAKESLFQQKYHRSCILRSPRPESVWLMDWSSAGMFEKFLSDADMAGNKCVCCVTIIVIISCYHIFLQEELLFLSFVVCMSMTSV